MTAANPTTDSPMGHNRATDDRLRKMRPDDRRELDLITETYRAALGLD